MLQTRLQIGGKMVGPSENIKQNETRHFPSHLKGRESRSSAPSSADGDWLIVERRPSQSAAGAQAGVEVETRQVTVFISGSLGGPGWSRFPNDEASEERDVFSHIRDQQ